MIIKENENPFDYDEYKKIYKKFINSYLNCLFIFVIKITIENLEKKAKMFNNFNKRILWKHYIFIYEITVFQFKNKTNNKG